MAGRRLYGVEKAAWARSGPTDTAMVDKSTAGTRASKAKPSKANGKKAAGAKAADASAKTKDLASDNSQPAARESLLPVPLSTDQIGAEGKLAPLAESVRYILARPQIALDNELPPRIAIVSALPGEGVTTVSSVFAAVLSHDSNAETCRVDLSWASPSKPGLFEVIMGDVELNDVLDWNGRTATLHSGAVTQSERHRLAQSEELDKLINDLASRFEHVVLDVPAILTGSDGLAMMRLADAYLLVVKHGVTTLQQVQMATEQLSHVNSLGSVLNQVRTRTPRLLRRWLGG